MARRDTSQCCGAAAGRSHRQRRSRESRQATRRSAFAGHEAIVGVSIRGRVARRCCRPRSLPADGALGTWRGGTRRADVGLRCRRRDLDARAAARRRSRWCRSSRPDASRCPLHNRRRRHGGRSRCERGRPRRTPQSPGSPEPALGTTREAASTRRTAWLTAVSASLMTIDKDWYCDFAFGFSSRSSVVARSAPIFPALRSSATACLWSSALLVLPTRRRRMSSLALMQAMTACGLEQRHPGTVPRRASRPTPVKVMPSRVSDTISGSLLRCSSASSLGEYSSTSHGVPHQRLTRSDRFATSAAQRVSSSATAAGRTTRRSMSLCRDSCRRVAEPNRTTESGGASYSATSCATRRCSSSRAPRRDVAR